MSKQLRDAFKETLKEIPRSVGTVEITKEDGYRMYEEINSEMKQYRREFTKKEKESQRATAKIVLTS
jgi:hypothetical protein